MSLQSNIEWTNSTWNPVTGCSKISPGCKNCYAEKLSHRLKAMGQSNYMNAFELTLHEKSLSLPITWKKRQMIFVNSMSDLFHKDIPLAFIQDVFKVMREASWHIFQVLTKRSERLAEINKLIHWPENVWLGVSVETAKYLYRINDLRNTSAHLKFISFEPLLGDVGSLNLDSVDWVIVGGESGPYARSMEKEWILKIKDQCVNNKVPFFFKQWGGFNKKKNGRLLNGKIWNEFPVKFQNFF